MLFMIGVLSLQNRSVFMGDGGDNVLHLMAIYLVFTRCGQVWSLDARRRRLRPPGGRPTAGPRAPCADRTWPASCCGRCPAAGLLIGAALGELELPWALALLRAAGRAGGLVAAGPRTRRGEPRTVLDIVANLMHNGAMLVIVVEVCFIYATAGWYKIQGSHWEDGTALYYPLHLDDFTPWPGLLARAGGAAARSSW